MKFYLKIIAIIMTLYWSAAIHAYAQSLVFYEASKGSAEMYEVKTDGDIGKRLGSINGSWRRSWTDVEYYKAGSRHLVLFYEASTGSAEMYEAKADGSLGRLIKRIEGGWRRTWTDVEYVEDGGDDLLLFYEASTGSAEIYRIKADGDIGKRVHTINGTWRRSWTDVEYYKAGGQDLMLFYDASTGSAEMYEIKADGDIGKRVKTINGGWRRSWTEISFNPMVRESLKAPMIRGNLVARTPKIKFEIAHLRDDKDLGGKYTIDAYYELYQHNQYPNLIQGNFSAILKEIPGDFWENNTNTLFATNSGGDFIFEAKGPHSFKKYDTKNPQRTRIMMDGKPLEGKRRWNAEVGITNNTGDEYFKEFRINRDRNTDKWYFYAYPRFQTADPFIDKDVYLIPKNAKNFQVAASHTDTDMVAAVLDTLGNDDLESGWRIVDHRDGSVKIQSRKVGGRVLAELEGGTKKIVLGRDSGSYSRRWVLKEAGNNSYCIENKSSRGYRLSFKQIGSAKGILALTKNRDSSTLWTLKPVR